MLVLVVAAPLHAQGVRGVVVDAQERVPVLGAFVTLIDENSYQRAAALTDSMGRFFLRAPVKGRYLLRAERIGYETITSAPLDLTGDTLFMRFEVPTVPIEIDSVDVRGTDRNCRRADASAVYQLWNAINTALRITMFSQQSASMEFSLFRYVRDLDREGKSLVAEERTFLSKTSALSFATLPPQDIHLGFLRVGKGERTLFGPDALLLLSDEFQNMHCFGFVRDRESNAIGMSFRPLRAAREVTDVKGVLWADARNAELRRITFEYTNLPSDLAITGSSGEVEFRKLPNGHWIVQKWWIRMPLFGGRVTPRGSLQQYLLGMREEGGHVISVDGQKTPSLHGAGVLEGIVLDSVTLQPVADALVFASTLPHEARTDSAGRYRLTGLPSGKYQMAVHTAPLVEVELPVRLKQVTISAHKENRFDVFSPTYATIYNKLCGTGHDIGSALVHGIVRHPVAMVPIQGAEVTAEWRGPTVRSEVVSDRSRTTKTRSNGRYYLCWMPENTDLQISAHALKRDLGSMNVNLDGALRHQQDFPVHW